MKSPRTLSLLGLGGIAWLVVAWSVDHRDTTTKRPVAAIFTRLNPDSPRVPQPTEARVSQTHAETVEAIRDYYRREQINIELSLEQRRYGAHYWDTELGFKQLIALNDQRVVRLKELSEEMTGVLREMTGDESSDIFEPVFGPETPGPNVTFLSADSRGKIEALIAELAQSGAIDPVRLLAHVREVLPPEEFARYAQWNAPRAARLRNQLVGYGASETEFTAIAQWSEHIDQSDAEAVTGSPATLELERQLGAPRFAEFLRLRSPEMQTAVHDLHRLGLPLEHAEWLRDFRAQGITAMQAIWQDPGASPAVKLARVSELQQTYRVSLLGALSPAGATFDETELLP